MLQNDINLLTNVLKQNGYMQLGNKVYCQHNKAEISFRKSKLLERKIEKLFRELLNNESLAKYDIIISKLQFNIKGFERKTGWKVFLNKGVIYQDNFINQEDPEMAQHDQYYIRRYENGYRVSEDKPFNEYFQYIRKVETEFYMKNKEILEILHENLLAKEKFMGGEFELKNAKDMELARLLVCYLGYEPFEKQRIKKL